MQRISLSSLRDLASDDPDAVSAEEVLALIAVAEAVTPFLEKFKAANVSSYDPELFVSLRSLNAALAKFTD